jgi:hypothetical protein
MVLVAWTREQRPQRTHWRSLDHPRVRFIRGLPVFVRRRAVKFGGQTQLNEG